MNQDQERLADLLGRPRDQKLPMDFTPYGKISRPAPEMMKKTPAEIAKEMSEATETEKGEEAEMSIQPKMNRAQRRAYAKRAKKQYKAKQKREMSVLYLCDPTKNKQCNKKSCYLYGGPCKATKHLEFAKQPVEKVKMVFPMSQKEAKELGVE